MVLFATIRPMPLLGGVSLEIPGPGGWNLFASSLAVLLVVVLSVWLKSRLTSRRLRRIAVEQRMRYSAVDRFNLAARVAEWLGIGASDVRVKDLMYRVGVSDYVYIFTAEYAIGTIGGLNRRRIVGRTFEPAGRSVPKLEKVRLSDGRLPVRDQYLAMIAELSSETVAPLSAAI